jgi:predicted NBD/HSP70 family sugar kinase
MAASGRDTGGDGGAAVELGVPGAGRRSTPDSAGSVSGSASGSASGSVSDSASGSGSASDSASDSATGSGSASGSASGPGSAPAVGNPAVAGGDSSLLRRLNAAAVLRALHTGGPATLTELVRATGSARATVESAVAGLTERGWVTESAAQPGRRVGRPAKRYRFRAEAGCVLGFDIGVHKVLAVAADLRGDVLAVRRTAVSPGHTAAERIAAARALGHRTLRGAGRAAADVRAVGVGTTGIVDADGRVALSDLLPDWTGTDLPAALSGPFAAPVAASNDTRLAALAEHWRGTAAGARDVLYVHAGRLISAGLLIGGRPYTGRHGAAGEMGTLRSSRWHAATRRLLTGWPDAQALFAAAAADDARALDAVDRFTADLAQGVAALVLAMDPELIVLGGGLSRAGALLTAPLARRVAELCLFPVDVTASTLGDEAVALGGVRLGLDAVERELFAVADLPSPAPAQG